MNAYCEPVVTLDLDLVLATKELPRLEPLLRERFEVTILSSGLGLLMEWAGGPEPDRLTPQRVMTVLACRRGHNR